MCIWRNIKSEGAFFFIFLFVPSHLNLESHHISLQPVFWCVLKEIAKIACCFHRVWPTARNNWIPPDGFARKLILPTFIAKFMGRFSYWFKNRTRFMSLHDKTSTDMWLLWLQSFPYYFVAVVNGNTPEWLHSETLHVFLSLWCLLHVATLIVMFNFVTLKIFGEDGVWTVSCHVLRHLSHLIILIPVTCIFCYFVLWPTNAQLFHKLSHSCMFQYYHIILRELVINTLPSYTSISNAPVDNTFL